MLDLEDNDEQEIEEVKDKAIIKGTTHYLVKWEGWPTEYNQWISEEDIDNAQNAIRQYEKNKKRKPNVKESAGMKNQHRDGCIEDWCASARPKPELALVQKGAIPVSISLIL